MTYVIITSENSGGINSRNDFMCITSKYSRGINIVIQAFRMVIFGSLHHFHVVHCASRNYTWKARILCGIEGVGQYIEELWGNDFPCSYIKSM